MIRIRQRFLSAATVIACAFGVPRCSSLYDVHRGAQKVTGIPFYVQAGSCTQETIYLETIYHIAIQIPSGSKETPPIVLMEKTIPTSAYVSNTMQELRDAVTASKASIESVRQRFIALDVYKPNVKPEVTLASNVTKPDSYVDYSNVHYVNVTRPFIGSASATAKLNANGTLAENTAEVEDKTVETLLSAFPVGEAILGAITDGGLGTLAIDGGKPATVQLTVAPLRFKHTLSKSEPSPVPCAARKELQLGDGTANFRREAVSDASGKDDKDGNAIAVSGKIVLPKKGGGL